MSTSPATEMRVLTVRQPYAWAIIHGGKNVENRVRNIAGGYRGPVAIHAGLAPYEQGNMAGRAHKQAHGTEVDTGIWFGAIIGVVNLIDAHDSGDCYHASIERAAHLYRTDREAFNGLPVTSGAGGLIGRASFCSTWAQDSAHHLVFANPRPIREPIPFKGALGLRHLPADVVAAILGVTS